MALHYWAYIFLSPGFNPEQHTTELSSATCRFKTVGIDMTEKEKVIDVAKQLVAEGVQMIELCGGFGPLWIAKVTEAINGAVPVGSVAYGPEARKPLLDILLSK
jgi:hypothetical protein